MMNALTSVEITNTLQSYHAVHDLKIKNDTAFRFDSLGTEVLQFKQIWLQIMIGGDAPALILNIIGNGRLWSGSFLDCSYFL